MKTKHDYLILALLLITTLLVILKAAGELYWIWVWVLAPTWLPCAVIGFAAVVAYVYKYHVKRWLR